MPSDPTAEMLVSTGEALWQSCACVGNPAPAVRWLADMMQDVRPGDTVLVMHVGRYTPSADRVGRLLKVEDEPYPDWEEPDEPAPKRPVWTISLFDGRTFRWENVQVVRLPVHSYEASWRHEHEHGRHAYHAEGGCIVCGWDQERESWLREQPAPTPQTGEGK